MPRPLATQQPLLGRYPVPLALVILLVQVALGVLLFATFQEWVPETLEAGDAWGGYLLGAYGGSRFLFEGPAGALSDRIERRLGLLLGFVLMLPAVGFMMFVRQEAFFLLFAAMLGFGTAFLWPATYAIAADLYPPEQRGRVIGFLNVAQLLGFGIGALSGAFLVGLGSIWQFVLAAAAVGSAFVAALVGIPDYRGGGLFSRVVAEDRPPLRSILSWRLVALSGIILGATVALAMAVPAIRPYGDDQLGVSFATLTIALIPAIIGGAAFFVPAGAISDRYGRWPPFFAGQLLVVSGLVAISFTQTLVLASVLALVVFAGNVLTVPAWNAAVMDLAPESHRGTLIGLSVALSGLGLALGPALGGFVVGEWGAPAAFRVAAVIAAVTASSVAVYGRSTPARPPAAVTVRVAEIPGGPGTP